MDKIICAIIKEDEYLPQISRKKLWETLHELNFSWERHNRKSILIDKEEIVCWRRNYLRTIKKSRDDNKQIYYLDETWLAIVISLESESDTSDESS
ncbi:MAG: hypothetical protein ACRD5R_16520 [Candidatus Acidiferrales bacterium]